MFVGLCGETRVTAPDLRFRDPTVTSKEPLSDSGKGLLPATSLVAGAGFEPATFGL